MTNITIYHNPRCSKSRQTLELIRDAGVEPEIVEYLKTPLSKKEIKSLFEALDLSSARDMMRTGESLYKDQGLADADSNQKLIAAMANHPILIERPIVVSKKGAAICRPPETVKDLL